MTDSKVMGKSAVDISSSLDDHRFSRDFSSCLPVFPYEKLNVNNHGNDASDIKRSDSFGIIENHAIKSLLPDDEDELFAGIIDDFDVGGMTRYVDELEEYDLFDSGGGIELESDPKESLIYGVSRLTLSDSVPNNGMMTYSTGQNCVGGAITGEHPAGEHPSRTLFVRNINSNVEDSELRELFQVYGDIRSLYTACKHRGFVMISYYDIRAARTALRALQHKSLRRRKLDIHFSIPKDNPSDKDLNQGTLVIFNLDPSVSNDDLLKIFGVYGEIKEIRETPQKTRHKFIEFYDTRASEAALRALNRRDIAGRCIKLEPSRPGGARRNLLNMSQDQDQDEFAIFRHQMSSSFSNSPPVNWPQIGGSMEQAQLSSLGKSPNFGSLSPTMSNFSAFSSIRHPQASNSPRVPPTGLDFMMNNGNSSYPDTFQQSLSFPESKSIKFPGTASSFVASSSNGSGIDNSSGLRSFWGSPKVYSEPTNSSSSFRGQPFQHPLTSNERTHGFSFSGHSPFLSPVQQAQSRHQHHVGSAPSERHLGFRHDHQEAFMKRTAGGFEFRPMMNNSVSSSGSIYENAGSSFGMIHSPRVNPMFISNGQSLGIGTNSLEGIHDRIHNKRVENNGNQVDNKQQFQLDLEKIKHGEESRTTLMIKNIPNKYDSKMLLEAINEKYQGTYDFLYLPIDFKNRCNVGYAFINMLSPSFIIPFYETFNGKKWERFNSEKVASLAYARIQGKTALIAHFQNSGVMNEDKRCRPIVFQPQGAESGEQVIQERFQVHKSNGAEMKELSGSPSEENWYD